MTGRTNARLRTHRRRFPPECPQGSAVLAVGHDVWRGPHRAQSTGGGHHTLRAMSDPDARSSRMPQHLADDLAACRGPAGEAATLPPACYVDPEVHALEEAAVFRRGWVGVGRSDTWAANGDYRTFELGGSRPSSCATTTADCGPTTTPAATGPPGSWKGRAHVRGCAAASTSGPMGWTVAWSERRACSARRASTPATTASTSSPSRRGTGSPW